MRRRRKRKQSERKLIGQVRLQRERNECAGCHACCYVMQVDELHKPARSDCVHFCAAGCDVHETAQQPAPCRSYECLYHAGVLGNNLELRPDHCGILFAVEASVWGQIVFAREVELGVLEPVLKREAVRLTDSTPRSQAFFMLHTLASNGLVLVVGQHSRRLIGPPPLLRAAREVASAELQRRGVTTLPQAGGNEWSYLNATTRPLGVDR